MKTLIKVLLFILIGLYAKAQLPSSTFPSRIFNGNTKAQWILLDSPVVNPILDTFHARYAGTQIVRIQGGDTAFWFYGGNRRWFRSLLDRDTLSLSNSLNFKLNISDTASMLLPYLRKADTTNKWVQDVYVRNDSLFKFKNGTETFLDTLGGGGGGSGTVTSVGLSLPSAFNVSPSSITTSGTFAVTAAGTTSQYIRGNGTLATTDTGMIPNFHLKVRSLFSGSSPITFNQTTGIIGITNANTTGTKGAASFTSAFSDNGSGVIDIADVVAAGSCTGCELTINSKGIITSYATGPGGATNNVNIGAGFRPVNAVTQEMRTYFAGFGTRLDTVANANGITWSADTTRGSGLPTYFYVDSLTTYANNGLYKDADTIKWGQPVSEAGNPAALTHNTEIPLNGFNAVFTGTGGLGIGTSTVGSRKINISATSTTQGINITTVDGTGINIVTSGTSANALFAQTGGSGTAVTGSSTGASGYGVLATSSNDNGFPFKANNFSTLTSSSTPVVAEFVRNVFGIPSDGVGLSIMFRGQTTSTTEVETGQIRNYLSTALHASRSSAFEFHLVNNAVSARKALLAATGQWTWDGYPGLTAQVDTTTYKPVALDASGNVVKMAGWPGSGGGGGGVTTMQPIGNSPNANGATISGVNLTLQPADGTYGGVVTTVSQTFAGNKTFTGPRTNFQGYSPIVNTQYLPTQVVADSIYNNRYIGFGGIDILPDGTLAIIYTDSDNHIGDSAFLKLAKSNDQGRTWTTDTLLRISGDTSVSMGGMGVSPSGRLIAFYYKFTSLAQHGMFIIYSDDEGQTWSTPYPVSNLSHPIYNPYGGLVKIGDNKLLFSWYGYTVGGMYQVYSITSADDGATWSSSTQVLGSEIVKPTETMFCYLGGNQILGLTRSDSSYTFTQTLSRDNGVTWDSIGRVNFGTPATPAWVKAYEDEYGKRVVVAYYRYAPTVDTQQIRAIYGYADNLITDGTSGWDLSTEVTIVDTVRGSGYISIVHPNYGPGGTGYYYDENSPQLRSALKFVRVPLSNGVPPIGPRGISGLTAPRIPVASGSNTLTDYATLKFNENNKSIVLNNSTVPVWSGYNAGVLETAKASIALNDDDGSLACMNNAYVNSDFRYKSNAAAGLMTMTSGRLHFYNAPSGALGDVISLTERFSIRANGDFWFNNSAGTSGQVLTSAGSGNPTVWSTVVSSQWVDVLSGTAINYGGTRVGIRSSSPRATLDVIGGTSGSGNHAIIFEDDNSAIGFSMIQRYTSATGTNQKNKVQFVDNNGWNIGTIADNFSGVPSPVMTMTQANNIAIGTTTFNGYKLQVEGAISTVTDSAGSPVNMAWIDTDGKIRKAAVPAGSTTLYTGDGTLAGNRTVTGSNNSLTYTGISNYRINANAFILDKTTATAPYTQAVLGTDNRLQLGFTPTATVYSKGSAMIIDTNNNAGLGVQMPTTAPRYATGLNTYIDNVLVEGGQFVGVANITSNTTLDLEKFYIRVDATSGNVTITLPAASTAFGASVGIHYVFKRIDNSGNTITVQRAGSDTIDGGTSITLTTQYEVKELQCSSTSTWDVR